LHEKFNSLKQQMKSLIRNSCFWFVTLMIFIKSVIFMWVVGSNYAAGLSIGGGFFSIPPYMTFIAFAIAMTSFALLFKGRGQLYSLLIINILCTVICIGHLWYYRGFSSFLNFFLFSMTSNLENLGATIVSLIKVVDMLFIIDIFISIFYIIKNKKAYKGVKRNVPAFIIVFFTSIIYLAFAHIKIDNFDRSINGQSLFLQSWAPTETMSNLGPVGYLVYDGYKYYENTKPYNLTEEEKVNIENWYKENNENLEDNKYSGIFKNKNLLIIQVESLENFVINQKINGQEITPNINKLLSNSIYFDNYHEQVWNGTSADCDLLVTANVFPVRSGATFFRYPGNYYPSSLPNIFNNAGYETESLHPDKAQYWNYKSALTSIGFKNFISEENYNVTEQINIGISDKNYFSEAIKFITELKEPFYAHTITLTNHAPFTLPDKEKKLDLPNNLKENVLGDYFQTVRYSDEQIATFLNNLDKAGKLDNTVVVIYGDHTGVHKYYDDKVNEVENREPWMDNNNWRIPFIIYSKDLAPETISVTGGQIDTLPTLAYLFGIPKDNYYYTMGRNLLNTKRDSTILADFTVIGNATEAEKEHLRKGMEISEPIVESNYFKNYK